jgi:hypothetical protein
MPSFARMRDRAEVYACPDGSAIREEAASRRLLRAIENVL